MRKQTKKVSFGPVPFFKSVTSPTGERWFARYKLDPWRRGASSPSIRYRLAKARTGCPSAFLFI